jgi:CRISPR/Cas system CSM-associated protein Csm3 (group 7 of RAMP superfamily)
MRREPEPKPFAFVRMPQKQPATQKAPDHDRVDPEALTGKLDLSFEVVSTYLFVGSGGYDYRDETVFYAFARSRDALVIPGTGIKGAVRSLVETISNSCISLAAPRERNRIPPNQQSCHSPDRLCPACRLFGMTGRESYGGRVSFSDAHPQTLIGPELVKIGELHRPRNSQRNTRKFYAERHFVPPEDMRPERNYRFVEAVGTGSVFTTTLSFTNLKREEMSLMLHALGIPYPHTLKLGGAKPRGFGSVRFMPVQLVLWRDPFADPERLAGTDLEQRLGAMCRATGLVEFDLLQEYQRQITAEADQPAPRELY